MADLLLAQAGGDRPALLFEDQRWTWSELLDACAARAALLHAMRQPGKPFHVGVLLDNVPEFPMWLGAAALAGAVVVGVNPTRRGPELARDVTHTDCQLLVTEEVHRPLLDGLDLGPALGDERLLVVDDAGDRGGRYQDLLAPHVGVDAAVVASGDLDESSLYLLLFTSGTTGAPKACICSHGRLARISQAVVQMFGLTPDDVCYQAMPLFHSNALMAGWGPAVAAGAVSALRRRFSASGFLPDVRRFGATYFNYVGKPLSYVLATPEQPDDADNPLQRVFGNEAADLDIDRFARRFGCRVVDGYGSTEGGAVVQRTPDMPPGALGRAPEGTLVVDPATGEERPRARFDDDGRLVNPDEAVGELVSRLGTGSFEGYWRNDDANAARVRDGFYWTGDLAYRDEAGFFYFAGRDADWLRVDGENLAAAPIERVLARHPDVVLAAVYGVPDEVVGDQLMAALQLRPGATFDPEEFAAFVASQPDLGTKSTPRYVRVVDDLPLTASNKVLKRTLQREAWARGDPVWWRPDRSAGYVPFTAADAAALARRFTERGRDAQLPPSARARP